MLSRKAPSKKIVEAEDEAVAFRMESAFLRLELASLRLEIAATTAELTAFGQQLKEAHASHD